MAYAVHELAAFFFPSPQYGGPMPSFELIPRDGVGRLLSAIDTPRQRWYRGVHEKAACLFRSLIKNHALADGNKRPAVVALVLFLRLNGVDFKKRQEEIVQFALRIAEHHGNYPLDEVTKWIRAKCRGRPRKLVGAYAKRWESERYALMVEARRRDMKLGAPARVPGRRIWVPFRFRSTIGTIRPREGPHVYLKGGPHDGRTAVLGGTLPAGTVLNFAAGRGLLASYTLSDRKYRDRRVADWMAAQPTKTRAGGRV